MTINEATRLLQLCLGLSCGGHCCPFLRFLQGSIRAYSVDSGWELRETHREQTASASSGFSSRIEGAGLHGCKAP